MARRDVERHENDENRVIEDPPMTSKLQDLFGKEHGSMYDPTAFKPDTAIHCGSKKWATHSIIICPQSGFFKKAFNSSPSDGLTKVIRLDEDDSFDFFDLIRWMYGNHDQPARSLSGICKLHIMGDKFMAPGFQEWTLKWFSREARRKMMKPLPAPPDTGSFLAAYESLLTQPRHQVTNLLKETRKVACDNEHTLMRHPKIWLLDSLFDKGNGLATDLCKTMAATSVIAKHDITAIVPVVCDVCGHEPGFWIFGRRTEISSCYINGPPDTGKAYCFWCAKQKVNVSDREHVAKVYDRKTITGSCSEPRCASKGSEWAVFHPSTVAAPKIQCCIWCSRDHALRINLIRGSY